MKSRVLLILLALALAACGEGSSSQPSSEVSSSEISSSASHSATEQTSEQPSPSEQTGEQSQTTEQVTSESEGEESSDLSYESSSEQTGVSSDETSNTSEEPSEEPTSEQTSDQPSQSQASDEYGWKVDFSEYGKTFATTLGKLITGKTTSYKNCLSEGAKAAAYPTEGSSKFIPFYHAPEASQVASTGECNREHTWPKSRGGDMIEKDPLVIRPTLNSENSDRSNYFYGLGGKSGSEWDPASCGYEGARGESARVILYAATRYASKGLSLSNNPSDSTGKHTMGTLKTLLEWNNKYQPTDFEKTVNERYAKMGYARNPFVDCPDFANYIYDSNGYRTAPYEGGTTPSSSASSSETPSSSSSSSEAPSSSSSSATSSQSSTPTPSSSTDFSNMDWKLVTSTSDLAVGDQIVFANVEAEAVAGAIPDTKAYMSAKTATFSNDKSEITTLPDDTNVFTVGKSGSNYTFSTDAGLLGTSAAKNVNYGDGTTTWSVSISDGTATVTSTKSSCGSLQYNAKDPRFTTYATEQQPIQIFKGFASGIPSESSESSSSSEAPSSSSSSATSSQSSTPTPSSSTDFSNMDWKLVTSAADLAAGDQIVFAYNKDNAVAGALSASSNLYLASETASFSSDKNEITSLPDGASLFTVGQSGSSYTFSTEAGLLGAKAAKKLAFGDGTTNWSVSISEGTATIANATSNYGTIKYNPGATPQRFTTYGNSSTGVELIQIYKAVSSTPVYPTAITLSGSDSVQVGKSTTLSVSYTPTNTNQKNVTWESSNTSIATVSNGVVKGVATGNVTITAKALTEAGTIITATKAITVEEYVPDAYTIMIYMCGSNLESYDSDYKEWGSQASDNLAEIMQVVNIPDDVNIIVETGGASGWDPNYASKIGASIPKALTRWRVENRKLVKEDSSLQPSNASMGAASTFQSFLEWGIKNYPAQKTGVIMWDHGGALEGCCQDENFNDDILTPTEFNTGVQAAYASTGTSKLEWIGYDCCLMAVQDIAEYNSDSFNYMFSSQETEPGGGWDYDKWVKTLADNPSVDTLTLGKSIVNSYFDKCADYYNEIADAYPDYEAEYRNYNDATLAVLDLSKMSAYKAAFEAMATSLSSIITSSTKWNAFAEIVNSAEKYGYYDDEDYAGYNNGYIYDVFNLSSFLSAIKDESAYSSVDVDSVIEALEDLIVYNKAGKDSPNACGLNVFCAISGYSEQKSYSTTQTRFSAWRNLNIKYGSWYN